MNDKAILTTENLNAYYGQSHILRDINFQLEKGTITSVMGRNGVGKTTLLKTLMGIILPGKGCIYYKGEDITNLPADKRARRRIGYVPQGREIFPKLSVYENLKLGLQARTDQVKKVPEDEIYDLFPVLGDMKKRMGGNLSGGQQQQLAIARTLVGNPEVMMLDEPTEGIQPSIIDDIEEVLKKLKAQGDKSIILVEQSFDFAREVSDFYYLIDRGQVVLEGSAENTLESDIKRYLVF